MTLKVQCDDCGKLEDASEPTYSNDRTRPYDWNQLTVGEGKYAYVNDYCPRCWLKHKPTDEEVSA